MSIPIKLLDELKQVASQFFNEQYQGKDLHVEACAENNTVHFLFTRKLTARQSIYSYYRPTLRYLFQW